MVEIRFFTFYEEEAVPMVFDGSEDFDSSVDGHPIENIAHCPAWLVGVGKVATGDIPPKFRYSYSSRILANPSLVPRSTLTA